MKLDELKTILYKRIIKLDKLDPKTSEQELIFKTKRNVYETILKLLEEINDI